MPLKKPRILSHKLVPSAPAAAPACAELSAFSFDVPACALVAGAPESEPVFAARAWSTIRCSADVSGNNFVPWQYISFTILRVVRYTKPVDFEMPHGVSIDDAYFVWNACTAASVASSYTPVISTFAPSNCVRTA